MIEERKKRAGIRNEIILQLIIVQKIKYELYSCIKDIIYVILEDNMERYYIL